MMNRQRSPKLAYFMLQIWAITGTSLIGLGLVNEAIAQPITPATDGTGTVINQQGNEYLITGGTQSGSNLFQSFEKFGLNSGQTANFVGNPALANILGRVTGGDVSIIDGLLKVSNSNANLYLMNPAGFIFGANAQLDLNGSFAATTATRIGFGDAQFFQSFGTNNYANLSSTPTGFIFDSPTGMIFNKGNLAVQPNQSLWLVGSSVLNLGTLQGGNLSVVAMPDQQQIRISQEGNLLSLAIAAAPLGANPVPETLKLFTSADLPQYLTGGGYENKVAISDQGEISLKQGNELIPFKTGDVGIAGTSQAQNLQLMAAGRVTPTDPALVQANNSLTVARFRQSVEDQLGYTFIDQRVDNPNALLYGGKSGAIATIVLKQNSGIESVTKALLEFAKTGQKLDAINIVAEGNQGYFWLGKDLVNGSTLAQYQAQLQQWRSALGDGADILIYGCFTALGMDGNALINQIANLTGADVAASLDTTGSQNFGGNWNLEYSTGKIEASNPFTPETLAVWQGKLATILVTNLADAGAGSLRNAIATAANGDLITPTVSGDVVLTGGSILWTTNNLTLDGTGQTFAIDGNGANRVLYLGNTTTNATINNITIKNGSLPAGNGGGIYFAGTGTLTVSNSIITNNTANSGGGIFNAGGGTIILTNSTVSGNTATPLGSGGGIFNTNGGSIILNNSTISGNAASSISVGGNGGGIYNVSGASSTTITLNNSTVSGNTATGNGGGINNTGSLAVGNLINSTVSGNTATGNGGGIYNYNNLSSFNIDNSTIANNSATNGGGLFNEGFSFSGTVAIANSIIANSTGGGDVAGGTLGFGTINFFGNNIVEDGTKTGIGISNVDPLLAPLGNYGGSTQTHFLLMGSPAIDKGNNTAASGLTTDQRGGSRFIDNVDIGAVEFQGTTLNILSGDGQSTLVNTSFKPIVIAATETTFGNPLAGLTIDLTAPSSGASTNPITFLEITDEFGQVSISPTANALEGTFSVTATAFKSGAGASATLTNQSELDITECPPDCDQTIDETPDNSVEETADIEVEDIQESLKQIFAQTKIKPALIYARFRPAPTPVEADQGLGNKDLVKDPTLKDPILKVDDGQGGQIEWEFKGDRLTDFLNSATEDFLHPRKTLGANDELELVMITSSGKVFRHSIPGATRARVMSKVRDFVGGVTNPSFGKSYLAPAQYLYDILVRPLEQELQAEKIGNLTYIMDDGLRALPLAALHDGKQFIIEKYSVGLMPSFSLTNTSDYVEPQNNSLLAMGASKFSDEPDLPAAPLEAQTIQKIWQEQGGTAGDVLVDDKFTVANFLAARKKTSYGILHLATHGEFNTGDDSDSYIRFEDQRVYLNELDKLQLGNPPLELLVLSACKTAIGDRNAELGFAGLALASGAKSAIGSIWYVSDAGTMGLMTRFYQELQNAPIKAEALRQAQLALLHGEVHQEGTQLLSSRGGAPIQLPPELASTASLDLSHPFFWSGFALVGNPW